MILLLSCYFLLVEECDQMWEDKGAQIFLNLPKHIHSTIYFKSNMFQKSPNSHRIFGLLLQDNLLFNNFKNGLIWSHCLRTTFREFSFRKKEVWTIWRSNGDKGAASVARPRCCQSPLPLLILSKVFFAKKLLRPRWRSEEAATAAVEQIMIVLFF